MTNIIADQSGVVVCGPNGTGEPEKSETQVALNGTDQGDMGHESFIMSRNPEDDVADHAKDRPDAERLWAFCKTARKPYDLIVVACLEAVKTLGFISEWSSDGDANDLAPGIALCGRLLPVCKPRESNGESKPAAVTKSSSQAEVLAWLEQNYPQLHAVAELDRAWVWLVWDGRGEENKAIREIIGKRGAGFIFTPKGHPLPSGKQGTWAHHCLAPIPFKRRDKSKNQSEQSTEPAMSDDELIAALGMA